MSDQPDWHICEHCFASCQYGRETSAYLFGDRPDFNYMIFECPECPNIDVILGVSPELSRSFSQEVVIYDFPVLTKDHRDRFLRNLDTGKAGCDALEYNQRLEMLAESARSLFVQPED